MLGDINDFIEALLRTEISKLKQNNRLFGFQYGSAETKANKGFIWFIDCWSRNNKPSEPNCLSLVVGVKNIHTYPELCTLDVSWGGDGDGLLLVNTIDLIEESIPWGDAAKEWIELGVPRLVENLNCCLSAWRYHVDNGA